MDEFTPFPAPSVSARRRRRAVRALLAAGVAAAMIALAGCAGIPTSGPVGVGNSQQGQDEGQGLIDPDKPQKGDEPAQIVMGFIDAAAGTTNNFEVARMFMTQQAAAKWDPLASVTIYPRGADLKDTPGNISGDAQNYSIDISVGGTVDAQGRYTAASEGKVTKLEFGLTQVGGQWRISSAPDGIVLSQYNFENLFRSYPIFFFNHDYQYFVPELRWFVARSAVATDVVQALLAGPSDWLKGAAISAFPEGTKLGPGTVSVAGGVATVTLDDAAQNANNSQKSLMRSQIETTLKQVSAISSVDVLAGGGEFGSTSEQTTKSPQVDGKPVVMAGGKLHRIAGTTLQAVPGAPDLSKSTPSRPAVSMDQRTYAFLTDGGTKLMRLSAADASHVTQLATSKGFVAPSFDPDSYVWTGDVANSGALVAFDTSGVKLTLAASWLAGRELLAVQVSRDGSRIAMLSRDKDGHAIVEVTGIVHGDNGVPKSFNTPIVLGAQFEDVKDISWAGDTDLALVATTAEAPQAAPWLLGVGGVSSSLGTVPNIRNITAGSDTGSIFAGTSDGSLYSRSGATWQELADAKGLDPAYPG